MTPEMETGTASHPRTGRGSAAKPNLIELARNALEESEHDEVKATEVLRDYVLDDLGYVYEICQLIIHRVARDEMHTTQYTARQRATTTVQPSPPAANPDSVKALASVIGRTLLDFRLPKGMPVLRDATAEDIAEAITRYRKTAATMTLRVQWLEAIAARLEPGQTVGQALDEVTVRRMYEEAEHAND
jgi:hypothetical protein